MQRVTRLKLLATMRIAKAIKLRRFILPLMQKDKNLKLMEILLMPKVSKQKLMVIVLMLKAVKTKPVSPPMMQMDNL